MGNKIITEKDFWKCSGGLLPTQFQSGQRIAKKKSGEKYITKADTATVGFADFSCKKLMLIMAILAAVIAIAVVATGGAALIAIGAIAGAAGALFGAVLGSLLCGQMVAKVRKWVTAKENFKIMGIPTITGDHVMECPLFGDKITFAPEIKSWGQALAQGGANLIGGVMEGMMAGALLGMGGAVFISGSSAFAAAGWRGLANAGLNFAKSIPSNVTVNLIESIIKFGLGMRGVMAVQNTAAAYGNTGEASLADFGEGVIAMEIGTYESAKNILTGQASWQDIVGLTLLIAPVGKSKREAEEAISNKAKTLESKPKTKVKDGDAFEADPMKREAKSNADGERIMTNRELKSFRKEMGELGVNVVLDTKGKILKGDAQAGFDFSTKTIYLKKPPKIYDAMHESIHALQYNRLGHEAYNKQTRLEKETYVYEELMKNQEILTLEQINHAKAYIYYVENGYWPMRNKEGLYILN